jgi:hypothetical protein
MSTHVNNYFYYSFLNVKTLCLLLIFINYLFEAECNSKTTLKNITTYSTDGNKTTSESITNSSTISTRSVENITQSNTTVDNHNFTQTSFESTYESTITTEFEEINPYESTTTQTIVTKAPNEYPEDSSFNILWILGFIIPIVLLLIIIKCRDRYKERQLVTETQINCGTIIDTTGFHDVSLHSSQSIPSLDRMGDVFNTQSMHNYWPSPAYTPTHPPFNPQDFPPSYESIVKNKIK